MIRQKSGSSREGKLPLPGQRKKLMGSINTAGASTYYLNSRAVPWTTYNTQLEKFNILVKAKNFLVFQGDVEGVASQDSRALAKLIDRISGYVFRRRGS
jgi:structural maintenance of chromosome 1